MHEQALSSPFVRFLIPQGEAWIFLAVIALLTFGGIGYLFVSGRRALERIAYGERAYREDDARKVETPDAYLRRIADLGDVERRIDPLPWLLITIGVLGTFIGLGMALSAMEGGEISDAKIKFLFGAVSFKFRTGAYGITGSLLVTLAKMFFDGRVGPFLAITALKMQGDYEPQTPRSMTGPLVDTMERLNGEAAQRAVSLQLALSTLLGEFKGATTQAVGDVRSAVLRVEDESLQIRTVMERFHIVAGQHEGLVRAASAQIDAVRAISDSLRSCVNDASLEFTGATKRLGAAGASIEGALVRVERTIADQMREEARTAEGRAIAAAKRNATFLDDLSNTNVARMDALHTSVKGHLEALASGQDDALRQHAATLDGVRCDVKIAVTGQTSALAALASSAQALGAAGEGLGGHLDRMRDGLKTALETHSAALAEGIEQVIKSAVLAHVEEVDAARSAVVGLLDSEREHRRSALESLSNAMENAHTALGALVQGIELSRVAGDKATRALLVDLDAAVQARLDPVASALRELHDLLGVQFNRVVDSIGDPSARASEALSRADQSVRDVLDALCPPLLATRDAQRDVLRGVTAIASSVGPLATIATGVDELAGNVVALRARVEASQTQQELSGLAEISAHLAEEQIELRRSMEQRVISLAGYLEGLPEAIRALVTRLDDFDALIALGTSVDERRPPPTEHGVLAIGGVRMGGESAP